MTSFWSTSTGENVAENPTKEFESGGGDFELIPDNSSVLAYVEDAAWEQNERGHMEEYINLKWKAQKPEGVEGRVVFQKLWVKDPDPRAKNAEKADQKRDKALRMLAAIDANAGGKLAKKGTQPSDDELMLALANKPMVITVKVWEMDTNDGKKTGNWVAAVHPKTKELKLGKADPAPKKQMAMAGGSAGDDLDDDIPFSAG